jgi:hypothetical protein
VPEPAEKELAFMDVSDEPKAFLYVIIPRDLHDKLVERAWCRRQSKSAMVREGLYALVSSDGTPRITEPS